MTPEEIRTYEKNKHGEANGWHGYPIYSGSTGSVEGVLIEIAAQLAELNRNMLNLTAAVGARETKP